MKRHATNWGRNIHNIHFDINMYIGEGEIGISQKVQNLLCKMNES